MRALVRRHRLVPIVLVTGMLLASCSAHGTAVSKAGNQYMAASAPEVEGTKTRVQGAAIGAVAGAALGAVAGALLGKNAVGLGAAIGSGVGTVAGLAYGEKVVRDRQAYADASAYLAARGEALNGQIDAARRFNSTLDDELRVARADQRVVEASLREAQHVQRQMREDIVREKAALAASRAEGVPAPELRQQDERIKQLQFEETRLTQHIARLSDDPGTQPFQVEQTVEH